MLSFDRERRQQLEPRDRSQRERLGRPADGEFRQVIAEEPEAVERSQGIGIDAESADLRHETQELEILGAVSPP